MKIQLEGVSEQTEDLQREVSSSYKGSALPALPPPALVSTGMGTSWKVMNRSGQPPTPRSCVPAPVKSDWVGSDGASLCALVGRGPWLKLSPLLKEESVCQLTSPLTFSCESRLGRMKRWGSFPHPVFTAHGEHCFLPPACPQHQHRQLLLGCLQHLDFGPYFWWSHFEWQDSSLWCQQGVIHSVQPRPDEWFLVTKKIICLFADGEGGLLSNLWFSL